MIDLCASFPFDVFFDEADSNASASSGLRLARLVRLGRLMRVASLARKRMSSNWMRLGKLTFYVVIAAHWFGCGWFFIGKVEDFPNDNFSPGSSERGHAGMLNEDQCGCTLWLCTGGCLRSRRSAQICAPPLCRRPASRLRQPSAVSSSRAM